MLCYLYSALEKLHDHCNYLSMLSLNVGTALNYSSASSPRVASSAWAHQICGCQKVPVEVTCWSWQKLAKRT